MTKAEDRLTNGREEIAARFFFPSPIQQEKPRHDQEASPILQKVTNSIAEILQTDFLLVPLRLNSSAPSLAPLVTHVNIVNGAFRK